ncbi:MAG: cytochrome b/b6 domain-containing protein [Gammaproteobacteria bacterium]|nr:cytochrome b/b6 domain-containing protein [Gammaproteobacteria bacterium]
MVQPKKKRVWDLPTRLFHWLLVLAFALAWATYDDSRHLDIHTISGYTFFALLLFRLVWGVVGSHYARFSEFNYTPGEVLSYLHSLFGDGTKYYIGHNPAGAWAIFILITLGLLLSTTGLIVLGGEEQQGLLAGYISFDQSEPFRMLHEMIAWGILTLVIVHVSGVIIESLLQRENLIGAMFRGTKWVVGESAMVPAHRLIASLIFISAIIWGGLSLNTYLISSDDQPYQPFKGPSLAMNDLWNEECGACHLAFHPSLLPARSWQYLFTQQENHFEEDLMLDEETLSELLNYARENSAEKNKTEAAWKINRSVMKNERPLKITSITYWKEKHSEISDAIWQKKSVQSKSNCGACHFDAEQGTFQDSAMKIPD